MASKKVKKAKAKEPVKEELPVLGFTAAESRINALVRELKESSRFETIKGKTVGRFWDKSWPSAPFEADMTIKQVTEAEVTNLLKKRSFQGQKVSAFIKALERACYGEDAEKKCVAPLASKEEAIHPPLQAVNIKTFNDPNLPSYASAAMAYLSAEAHTTRLGRLAKFVEVVFKDNLAGDLWLLWSHCYNESAPSRTDISSDEEAAKSRERLKDCLKTHCPDAFTNIETALLSPGVGIGRLAMSAGATEVCPPLWWLLEIILQIFGAAQPVVDGVTLKDYWTVRPISAQLMFDAIIHGLPKKDEALRAEFSAMFSFISPDDLIKLTKKRARLKEGAWSRLN